MYEERLKKFTLQRIVTIDSYKILEKELKSILYTKVNEISLELVRAKLHEFTTNNHLSIQFNVYIENENQITVNPTTFEGCLLWDYISNAK